MTAYEAVSTVISACTVIVGAVGLFYVVRQVRLLSNQVNDARLQAEAETQRRREQATMEFISATIDKLQDFYEHIPAAGSPGVEPFIAEAMRRGSPQFIALRDYLNYLEDLSVGVNMKIFDRDVVYRSIGGRMIRARATYGPWMLAERDVLGFPDLYYELGRCVDEFKELTPLNGMVA